MSLVIDTCDPALGEVRQVAARGRAHLVGYDADRAHRKLCRYLGDDPDRWDQQRFGPSDVGDPDTSFVQLKPDSLITKDLSYRAAGQWPAREPDNRTFRTQLWARWRAQGHRAWSRARGLTK